MEKITFGHPEMGSDQHHNTLEMFKILRGVLGQVDVEGELEELKTYYGIASNPMSEAIYSWVREITHLYNEGVVLKNAVELGLSNTRIEKEESYHGLSTSERQG